jgi:hypothetical protein
MIPARQFFAFCEYAGLQNASSLCNDEQKRTEFSFYFNLLQYSMLLAQGLRRTQHLFVRPI